MFAGPGCVFPKTKGSQMKDQFAKASFLSLHCNETVKSTDTVLELQD